MIVSHGEKVTKRGAGLRGMTVSLGEEVTKRGAGLRGMIVSHGDRELATHAYVLRNTNHEPMLGNRLKKRYRHLRKWARRTGVTCYRLYERDIPEYPLIVDWYDGDVVAWLYERKRDETPQQAAAYVADVLNEIQQGLAIGPESLFLKQRMRQSDEFQYQRMAETRHVRVVEEQGLNFEVNLSDYVDTGLFLDHRPLRATMHAQSANKRVLNLFAYTGSFTCYAIAGGATQTITVDLSHTYCDWAKRNLAHNGFYTSRNHQIIQMDVLQFLQEATQLPHRFDIIVCDPPTFSNSKRMDADSFSIVRDQAMLIRQCVQLLAPGGTLYFSTNARGFRLQDGPHLRSLEVKEISETTIPEDFRNRRIHQCWRIAR